MKYLLFIAAITAIISCNQSQTKEEHIAATSVYSATEIKTGGNKMIRSMASTMSGNPKSHCRISRCHLAYSNDNM